jgi:polyisoprenoid-binding protein YceI
MLTSQGVARVIFMARGPVGLSFVGKSDQILLTEKDGVLVICVRLDSLSTGISFRDNHMRDRHLETEKYPLATLEVEKSQLQWPNAVPVSAKAKGKLTLHGVTRTVNITYQAHGTDKLAFIEGSMHVNMKIFKIETPVHLGMSVRPGVEISIKMAIADMCVAREI